MQAADIRALPPGTALLLATGARPALIALRPWSASPDATRISAGIRQAEQAMRHGALADTDLAPAGGWPGTGQCGAGPAVVAPAADRQASARPGWGAR